MALGIRSASGTQRLIRPQSSAVAAGSFSPSSISSIARALPTKRGSSQVEPQSGTRPMRRKASRKYELSAATTRSQARASETPTPAATPFTAATRGLADRRIELTKGL